MKLNEKLATIQTKFKSKKSRYNSFGKYYFRSAEDILEATKPYLLEMGVSVVIKEQIVATEPVPIMESKAIFSDGENAIHATAIVGVDLNQKGMQTPQQFGSCSSYGKKYALGNLFLIDDTQDSDASNVGTKNVAAKKPKLDVGSEAFKKAKDYITAGGSLSAISQKYDLTSAASKSLKTL